MAHYFRGGLLEANVDTLNLRQRDLETLLPIAKRLDAELLKYQHEYQSCTITDSNLRWR